MSLIYSELLFPPSGPPSELPCNVRSQIDVKMQENGSYVDSSRVCQDTPQLRSAYLNVKISNFRSKSSRSHKVHFNTSFCQIFSKLKIFDVFVSQKITFESLFLGNTLCRTQSKGTRKKTNLQNKDMTSFILKEHQTVHIASRVRRLIRREEITRLCRSN